MVSVPYADNRIGTSSNRSNTSFNSWERFTFGSNFTSFLLCGIRVLQGKKNKFPNQPQRELDQEFQMMRSLWVTECPPWSDDAGLSLRVQRTTGIVAYFWRNQNGIFSDQTSANDDIHLTDISSCSRQAPFGLACSCWLVVFPSSTMYSCKSTTTGIKSIWCNLNALIYAHAGFLNDCTEWDRVPQENKSHKKKINEPKRTIYDYPFDVVISLSIPSKHNTETIQGRYCPYDVEAPSGLGPNVDCVLRSSFHLLNKKQRK